MVAIVYTSAAAMPQSCMGTYRRVYVIDVAPEHAAVAIRPKDQPPKYEIIEGSRSPIQPRGWRPTSVRDKTVLKVLRDYGPKNVGYTEACAYRRCIAAAVEWAENYNLKSGKVYEVSEEGIKRRQARDPSRLNEIHPITMESKK